MVFILDAHSHFVLVSSDGVPIMGREPYLD
ncbi:hypothetical protein ERICI_00540 [Paenibacillus larvae subsp. larvae]|uniref:Uncharacterized protein n=2 Tax=Paenibacillus larvae subsp. larvae TaxID=147375 RepID=V9W2U5_9BACL|nr:hypothetical protein ERIC2_c06310 [Paenibacillus larvae subsp. larvae DSM 25430]AVF20473.1 hypothetical protein ERICI_00540 [Paenibacillus larvae subsp. larvae]AVG11075.1 hypothetical protein ERICII_00638 [Paenibacillus larvae subsp. larvae DSM 25430]ETK28572.1 hypothetical protein ERIC1_1c20410 [Paenibacillus larvae subsp. larvae DSM 25719]QHZ53510.1 hypothetical protein ERICV_04464 [Paenibacillus larvae subsp. larvae]